MNIVNLEILRTSLSSNVGATQGPFINRNSTFQATVKGSGSVSATVIIEVSNDRENFMTLGTITLSGTGAASDGFVSAAPWAFFRAKTTAISGTNAVVTVFAGV